MFPVKTGHRKMCACFYFQEVIVIVSLLVSVIVIQAAAAHPKCFCQSRYQHQKKQIILKQFLNPSIASLFVKRYTSKFCCWSINCEMDLSPNTFLSSLLSTNHKDPFGHQIPAFSVFLQLEINKVRQHLMSMM